MPTPSRFPILAGLLLNLLVAVTTAPAADEPVGIPLPLGGGAEIRFLSINKIYPQYIADPQRLTLGIERIWVSHNDIDRSGSNRYILRAGGEAGFADLYLPGDERPLLQLSLFGGFLGIADLKQNNDTIGWDGKYGFAFALQPTDYLILRTGMHHTSGHLGDDNEVKSMLPGVSYSRDEVFAAVSQVCRQWRIYGEGGYGYDINDKIQKPWRVQGGIEYDAPTAFYYRGLGWYAAIDLSSLEERNWKLDTAIQLGLVGTPFVGTWRLGISYVSGRNPVSDLVLKTERYLSLALSINL